MPETMLEIENLRAGYGAINVLWDILRSGRGGVDGISGWVEWSG